LFHFYNERVTVEKLIERAKNILRLRHLPTGRFWGLRFFMPCFSHLTNSKSEGWAGYVEQT
jgi:hypothetical protein